MPKTELEKVHLPPDVDIVQFVLNAYEMSVLQGSGWLQQKPGPLTWRELDDLMRKGKLEHPLPQGVLMWNFDYLFGRSMKLRIFREPETGQLFIENYWYDHTKEQLQELLEKAGVETEGRVLHNGLRTEWVIDDGS